MMNFGRGEISGLETGQTSRVAIKPRSFSPKPTVRIQAYIDAWAQNAAERMVHPSGPGSLIGKYVTWKFATPFLIFQDSYHSSLQDQPIDISLRADSNPASVTTETNMTKSIGIYTRQTSNKWTVVRKGPPLKAVREHLYRLANFGN